jgi:hypothetical protein
VIVQNRLIERGGAGWRTTKQGDSFLENEGDSVSTEVELGADDDQPKKAV